MGWALRSLWLNSWVLWWEDSFPLLGLGLHTHDREGEKQGQVSDLQEENKYTGGLGPQGFLARKRHGAPCAWIKAQDVTSQSASEAVVPLSPRTPPPPHPTLLPLCHFPNSFRARGPWAGPLRSFNPPPLPLPPRRSSQSCQKAQEQNCLASELYEFEFHTGPAPGGA